MLSPTGILTHTEVLNHVKTGDLTIDPPIDKFQLQPHSIDLRLGFTFLIPKSWQLTKHGREAITSDYTQTNNNFQVIELEPGQFFDILPNEYVVFSTLEKLTLPDNLMAIMYPRSSVNRRGLSVDLSGIVDAGYSGHLIIPVRNKTPNQTIRVYPGERFCQIVFHTLSQPVNTKISRFHQRDVATTFGSQKEKHTNEITLIKKGQIKELKHKHQIKINK
jgi:dCTP deaminase